MNITEVKKLKDGDIVAVQCNNVIDYGIFLARYSPSINLVQMYFKNVTQNLLSQFGLSSAAIYGNNIFDVPIQYILHKEQSNPFEQYVYNRQFKQLCGKLVYVPILQKIGRIISINILSDRAEDALSYVNQSRSRSSAVIVIPRPEIKYYIYVDSSPQIEPFDIDPESFILLEFPAQINKLLPSNKQINTNLLHAIFQSVKNNK